MTLNINKSVFVPKFFPYLKDYSHRYEVYMGSAGSAKSYFITQKLIIRALSEQIRILVCRRYGTTIRNTVFSLFKEILTKWQLTPYVKIKETDFTITFPNGSEILFTGLDEETKLLSLNNISTIFVEEAFEVPKDIFEQLNLRMRGGAENQQIILAFNPISKSSWLYDFITNPPESFLYIHSTYQDNPFLSAEYIASLEELKIRNPQKARIFCYGEWGVNTDALVLTNWEVRNINPDEISGEYRMGEDTGWFDPTAIIACVYNEKQRTIYVLQEFYKQHQTLDDIAEAMAGFRTKHAKIYCDCAEPRTIEFLKRKGFNAVPSLKGPDSVSAGLAFLQNNKIIVDASCTNLISELESYCYIKDKNTGEYTDKPEDANNHAVDALRYSVCDLYHGGKLRTISKGVLGL